MVPEICTKRWRLKDDTYAPEERARAAELYVRHGSKATTTIRELGLSRTQLVSWHKERPDDVGLAERRDGHRAPTWARPDSWSWASSATFSLARVGQDRCARRYPRAKGGGARRSSPMTSSRQRSSTARRAMAGSWRQPRTRGGPGVGKVGKVGDVGGAVTKVEKVSCMSLKESHA